MGSRMRSAAETSGTNATANGSAAETSGTATAGSSPHHVIQVLMSQQYVEKLLDVSDWKNEGISGSTATAGSSPHHVIQTELMSQNYVEKLLDVSDLKNEGLKKLLKDYLDECDKTITYTKVVQEYLNSHQSLNISHEQFLSDLNGVLRQQVLMREHLQSFKNHHLQKLHRAQFWTKVSAVGFTAVVVVITTAAAASASAPILSAILTSASILLSKVWESTVSSHLGNREDDAKKHLEIIHSAALGAEITVGGLSSLYSSASQFETQTKSISEMPESADAGEERKKLVEILKFAADLRQDIESAKAYTLTSFIKHLNSLTRLS